MNFKIGINRLWQLGLTVFRHDSVKDIFWMFVERGMVMCGALFSGVLVARYLGPTQAGAINFAYAAQGFLAALLGLGLEAVAIRRLVAEKAELETLRNTIWTLLSLTGLAGTFVLVALAAVTSEGYQVSISLIAVALPLLFTRGQIFEWIFRSRSEFRKLSRVRMFGIVAMQILKAVLVLVHASFEALVGVIAIEALLLYGISRLRFRQARLNEPRLRFHLNRPLVGKLLRESWPLLLAGFAVMAYTKLDVVMLQMMKGQTEVGIYAAATKLSELWHMIPVIICSGFYAKWIQWYETDQIKFSRSMRWFFFALAGGATLAAIAIQLVGSDLVRLIYGRDYWESAAPLKIHIWAALPVFVGCVLGQLYVIWGLSRAMLVGAISGAVSNALLNLIWIPSFGASGAALATAISYCVSVGTPLLVSRQVRSKFLAIWKPAIS